MSVSRSAYLLQSERRIDRRCWGAFPEIREESFDAAFSNFHRGIQIRIVVGLVEIIEQKDILFVGACNQPHCLVLPFSVEVIRPAA